MEFTEFDTKYIRLGKRSSGRLVLVDPSRHYHVTLYLRMEDELRPFQQVQIPDKRHTIWFIWSHRILVIRRDQKFRILWQGELVKTICCRLAWLSLPLTTNLHP